MGKIACNRCGKVYNEFLGHRFWSGRFTEEGVDEVYEILCDNCHSVVTDR